MGLFDPGISSNQTLSAVQEVTANIYVSDLRWFAAAAIVYVYPWATWELSCAIATCCHAFGLSTFCVMPVLVLNAC